MELDGDRINFRSFVSKQTQKPLQNPLVTTRQLRLMVRPLKVGRVKVRVEGTVRLLRVVMERLKAEKEKGKARQRQKVERQRRKVER